MSPAMADDRLELRYVRLSDLRRWSGNAKLHDIGALIQSIKRYGFKDPPKVEPTLNDGQGGIVAGNGRWEALALMRDDGEEPPRGIALDEDGEWCVPVLFGVDAASRAEAEAFGVDANNLTVSGGDLGIDSMLGLWDEQSLTTLLTSLGEEGELPITLDGEDLDALLAGPPRGSEHASQGPTCPGCGRPLPTS